MKKADMRLRSIALTLLLVGLLALLVRVWPENTHSGTVITPPEAIMERDPVKRHFDWAVTQLSTGHYQQAITGFRAVLEQSPGMPEAHVNTGFAQIELQQYEHAVHSFRTAIDLRPGQVNAYWGLAVSLEGLCDIAGATGAMRTYVHLAQPDDAFLTRANAALWEWEQLKSEGKDHSQAILACRQNRDLPGES